MGELCRKMCLGVSTLFRIQKVPTHFFGAFLAHMAVRPGAHCYQTDAIYAAMQNNAANTDPQNIISSSTLSLPSQAAREKCKKKGCFGSCCWCVQRIWLPRCGLTPNDRVRNLLKEPPLCCCWNLFNKVAKTSPCIVYQSASVGWWVVTHKQRNHIAKKLAGYKIHLHFVPGQIQGPN